nr:CXXC-type zinc finger protein 1-like [Aedes albopictus]
MSGRTSGKDAKSGSKGARSKEKQSEVVNISGETNVVVVVTEEGNDPAVDRQGDEKVPEQNCTFCQEADDNEMVQCDRCDRWIHFACVGVTEEIADSSWSCPKCNVTTGVQRSSSSAINRLPAGSSGRPEQQKSSAPKATVGTGKKERCNAMSEPLGKTMVAHGTARHCKSAASLTSSSSRRSHLQLQLQRLEEEREYEQQQAKKHRAYLDRKYELLEQMHSHTGSESSVSQGRKCSIPKDIRRKTTPDELKLDLLHRRISLVGATTRWKV